jgi:hypothetical protein
VGTAKSGGDCRILKRHSTSTIITFLDKLSPKISNVSSVNNPFNNVKKDSQLGAFGTATSYGLDGRVFKSGSRKRIFFFKNGRTSRSQWPRGLRCGSAAACLLRMRVRIPPGAWMFFSCECCVFYLRPADPSSRGVLPDVVCLSVIVKPR